MTKDDPHAALHLLRAGGELVRGNALVALGARPEREFEGCEEYTALSYRACKEVLTDQGRFSATVNAARYDAMHGARTIVAMDDPEHKAYRSLVSAAFFSQGLERWARDAIPQVVAAQLDDLRARPLPVDMVAAFTFPVPIQIIVSLLGVPRADWPMLLEWIDTLVTRAATDDGHAATARINKYVAEIVAARRRAPQNDLASALTGADVDGMHLSDAMITAFLVLLLAAGGETTARTLGTLLSYLLRDPEQLDAVRADRALIGPAIDEALRIEPPLQRIRRQCTVNTEVAGVPVPAGAHVIAHIGAANRDPARWPDPDRFEIHRASLPSLAFGGGAHYCIGAQLAKRELASAVGEVLDRVSGLRLDPDRQPPRISGLTMRGPQEVWVMHDGVRMVADG